MVLGVRVHGDTAADHEVTLDHLFREVPVPNKIGVPLLYKTQPGTGGDDSHIRSNAIVRFMADPVDGFAPDEWQYGGRRGPAPPVVLARRDRLPFSRHDWDAVNDYITEWLEEAGDEDDRAAASARILTPTAFQAFVRAHLDSSPLAFLSLQFPLRSTVTPHGLSVAELNGCEGEVVRYSRDRVGVKFQDRDVTALKPERLTLVREEPLEPTAKRQDTGDGKEAEEAKAARAKHLAHKDAMAIAERFCECLHQDTFPEMGDLHLFGVGCDYKSRAQEVLAVWQGAVKAEQLGAEELAKALTDDTMKELFEKTCRSLAKSKVPNAPYAMELIKNNFAALEWDSL